MGRWLLRSVLAAAGCNICDHMLSVRLVAPLVTTWLYGRMGWFNGRPTDLLSVYSVCSACPLVGPNRALPETEDSWS